MFETTSIHQPGWRSVASGLAAAVVATALVAVPSGADGLAPEPGARLAVSAATSKAALGKRPTLTGPSRVTNGNDFRLRGRVKPVPKAKAGNKRRIKITLERRDDGAATWRRDGRDRTSARGTFSFRVAMDGTSRAYRACVGSRCSKPVAVTSVPAPPPPPPPPPAPVGGSIDYAWTRAGDGFSFSAAVRDLFVTDIRYNTLDQAIGEAKIYYSLDGVGTITNTTPRNGSPDFTEIRPVYPVGSSVCQLAKVQDSFSGARRSYSHLEVAVADQPDRSDTGFCVLDLARGSGVGTLSPGASGVQTYDETRFGSSADFAFYVPEASASTVMAELEQPAFWVLQRGIGEYGVQNERGPGVCHIGIAVVATSSGGAGVCAQGVQ